MRLASFAAVAGVWACHLLPVLPSSAAIVSLAILAAALLRLVPVASAALCGYLIAALAAVTALDARWPVERHGEDLLVTGTVVSLPERRASTEASGGRPLPTEALAQVGGRFLFRPDAGQDRDLPPLIRVSWYLDAPLPEAGSRWRLTLRMQAPRGSMNPAAFDYERWLIARGIGATANVREFPPPRRSDPTGRDHRVAPTLLLALRARMDAALRTAIGGHPRASIVHGLALGERGGITRHEWEVFARTGTAHLMAISGMHVGMVASLVFLLARFSLGGAARARETAVFAGWLAAAAYAALSGFAVPVRRALVMLAAAGVHLCLRRQSVAASAWFLALAVVVLADPLSPLTIGFWLSFGAVGLILWVVVCRRAQPGAAMQLIRIQWAISIGLLPLTLWFFQRGSVVSPLANLAAVPLFGTFVIPASLFGAVLAALSPTAGAMVLGVLMAVLDQVWAALEWISAMPWSQRFTLRPPGWTIVSACAAALVMLAPGPRLFRFLAGLALAAPMLAWSPSMPQHGGWRLVLLDVGQGLAAVIHTQNHTLVYDTGPSFGPDSDAGLRVVVPYLRAHGVRRVDKLFVSHSHDDHQGGAASLLTAFPGTPAWGGDPHRMAVDAEPCLVGQTWSWDGVVFTVLHPDGTDPDRGPNPSSCVLEVDGPGGRLLLTGDIEWSGELLLARPGSRLRHSEVVVVAHHGSRTSSIPRFVARVAPDLALVPAGFGNQWRFPHPEVAGRWRDAGAAVHVVGIEGALTVEAGPGAGVSRPAGERAKQRAWWRVE